MREKSGSLPNDFQNTATQNYLSNNRLHDMDAYFKLSSKYYTYCTYCEIFTTCKIQNYERARSTLRHQKLAPRQAYKVKDCFQ